MKQKVVKSRKKPAASDWKKASESSLPWINPVGGYGDMLMVAGVLKQVTEGDPSRRFNMVRRTRYVNFFKGHESIVKFGYPGKDEQIQDVRVRDLTEVVAEALR